MSIQTKTKMIVEQNSKNVVNDLDLNQNITEQEKRIIRNMHGSLIRQLQNAVSDFQAIEMSIKKINQEMIIRGAEIAMSRKLTEKEISNVIDDPTSVQAMIQEKINSKAHANLLNAVRDIEDRHNDIVKLEKVKNIFIYRTLTKYIN